ncbi:MAG TPA: hypothetical protein VGM62_20275, partial [Chthoniobacterales bacterium]
MTDLVVNNIWIVAAIPLAASLAILGLAGKRRGPSAALAIIGQIGALVMSLTAFTATLRTPNFRAFQNFTWFTFGEQSLRLGWLIDPLAAAMLV